MNAEIVNGVIERLKAAYDHVFAKREKISREAGMEDVRVARENALTHPHLSTTPLPEALERANNVYNKLEREAAPLIEKATIALLAVDQAAREVEAVKTALNTKQLSEHSKAALSLWMTRTLHGYVCYPAMLAVRWISSSIPVNGTERRCPSKSPTTCAPSASGPVCEPSS